MSHMTVVSKGKPYPACIRQRHSRHDGQQCMRRAPPGGSIRRPLQALECCRALLRRQNRSYACSELLFWPPSAWPEALCECCPFSAGHSGNGLGNPFQPFLRKCGDRSPGMPCPCSIHTARVCACCPQTDPRSSYIMPPLMGTFAAVYSICYWQSNLCTLHCIQWCRWEHVHKLVALPPMDPSVCRRTILHTQVPTWTWGRR